MARFAFDIELTSEVAEAFDWDKRLMSVPMSEKETRQLGAHIIFVHAGLGALADSLIAFVEGRERFGAPDPELKSAIGNITGKMHTLAAHQGQVREVFGHAVFVNVFPKAKKGPVQ